MDLDPDGQTVMDPSDPNQSRSLMGIALRNEQMKKGVQGDTGEDKDDAYQRRMNKKQRKKLI
jgi:hypothetical protein